MTTQTTTAPGALATPVIVREYRLQRTSSSGLRGLLARLRGDRAALDRWHWQPTAARPADLQQEILRAQLRMLPR